MTFELPPLPYGYNALEPVIDAETMRLHHGKHHQAYTDKLNAALNGISELKGKPIEDIFSSISSHPTAVRNNAGGYWNHLFFWDTMKKGGSEPSDKLNNAIVRDFGSIEQLKEQFNTSGLNLFGSGWVWLIADPQGKLKITTTNNQDNPLMDVVPDKGTPLLVNDVWEHAYYLSYRNDRPAYLKAWWDIVDWEQVSRRYAN